MPFLWAECGNFRAYYDPLPFDLGSLGSHFHYFWCTISWALGGIFLLKRTSDFCGGRCLCVFFGLFGKRENKVVFEDNTSSSSRLKLS